MRVDFPVKDCLIWENHGMIKMHHAYMHIFVKQCLLNKASLMLIFVCQIMTELTCYSFHSEDRVVSTDVLNEQSHSKYNPSSYRQAFGQVICKDLRLPQTVGSVNIL